ncbi:type 1 glutamine amidotransferase domain-containing protein [Paraburkholderia strydomiana]|uniref:type 1 glutamine amidotransferase domain-containing protein n=1 Tax=Paraburkholderia strydomiana TaxID=1245417 RepID=UPI0038BA10E0
MKVLMMLTSHDELGDTGRKTGFRRKELSAPYYKFREAGAQITLASPKSGRPPLESKSNESANQINDTHRFEADEAAMAALSQTKRLADIQEADFDTVFYPGGNGPLWDLAEDATSIALIKASLTARKPVAPVWHAPGVRRRVKNRDGRPLVEGKRVTGFANTNVEAVGLTAIVPFLVEDELKTKGAIYSRGPDWSSYVVEDGLLITGQNAGSSLASVRALTTAGSVDK